MINALSTLAGFIGRLNLTAMAALVGVRSPAGGAPMTIAGELAFVRYSSERAILSRPLLMSFPRSPED